MFILHMHIFHILEIEDLMLMKKMAGDGQGKQAVLCKLCILFYEADDVIGKK